MERTTSKSQWLGPPIAHLDGNNVYTQCETSTGERIATGDFIFLLPADPCVDLYIARIESLYEDGNTHQKKLHVRWYYRQKDLHHQPPSISMENEVYHTNYFDCQLVESVVGHCRIVQKGDRHVSFTSRMSRTQDARMEVYVCEFSYSAETGTFTAIQTSFDSAYLRLDLGFNHEDAILVKNMADDLLNVEKSLPRELAAPHWEARRQDWTLKAKNAMTMKDVKQILIELEDGFLILKDQRMSPKQTSAWRKRVTEITTLRLLSKYVNSFKQRIMHRINNVWNSEGHDVQENQPEERPNRRKGKFWDSVSSRKKVKEAHGNNEVDYSHPDVPTNQGFLRAGEVYEIDQKHLPCKAPAHLRFIRAVMVVELSGVHVTVRFPSILSLEAYFGKEYEKSHSQPDANERDTRYLHDQPLEDFGTELELDEQFIMNLVDAKKMLLRNIPCTVYLQQCHLESFWISPKSFTSDKDLDSRFGFDSSKSDCHMKNSDEGAFISPLHDSVASTKINNSSMHNPCGQKKTEKSNTLKSEVHNAWRLEHVNAPGVTITECNATDDEVIRALNEQGPAAEILAQMQYPVSLLTTEINEDSKLRQYSEGCEGPIRWGTKKKISSQYRCRGPSLSGCERGNKDHASEEEAPSQSKQKALILRIASPNCNIRSASDDNIKSSKSLPLTVEKEKLNILKLPKDMQGRWSSERYKAAQLKLLDIMHDREAVPGKPILRPALREEARKHIGDTGLLDHLLKHMTDTVISNGERFRRRHNSEGAMEYWLEDATLMEIRKQAGIDDPYWMPPPGWKLGDPVQKDSFYGYCSGMSPLEAEEMRQLKKDMEKLKSEMKSLSLQMKTRLEISKHTLGSQNGATCSSKVFEEKMKNQREGMKTEIWELHKLHKKFQFSIDIGPREQPSEAVQFMEHTDSELEGTKGHGENQVLKSSSISFTRCSIQDQLEKIEQEIGKLYEEAALKYNSLTSEKILIEEQLADLWKAIAAMQEDIIFVLNSIGLSHVNGLSGHSPTIPLLLAAGKRAPPKTPVAEADNISQIIPYHEASNSDDRIFFKVAATFSINNKNANKAPGDGSSTNNVANENAALKINFLDLREHLSQNQEQIQCGFRPCKPQGSFLWPSMGMANSSAVNHIPIEDVLSSIQASTTPASINSVILTCSSSDNETSNSDSRRNNQNNEANYVCAAALEDDSEYQYKRVSSQPVVGPCSSPQLVSPGETDGLLKMWIPDVFPVSRDGNASCSQDPTRTLQNVIMPLPQRQPVGAKMCHMEMRVSTLESPSQDDISLKNPHLCHVYSKASESSFLIQNESSLTLGVHSNNDNLSGLLSTHSMQSGGGNAFTQLCPSSSNSCSLEAGLAPTSHWMATKLAPKIVQISSVTSKQRELERIQDASMLGSTLTPHLVDNIQYGVIGNDAHLFTMAGNFLNINLTNLATSKVPYEGLLQPEKQPKNSEHNTPMELAWLGLAPSSTVSAPCIS